MKFKIKIEFEEEAETIEEILKCKTCKKPLLKIEEHIYKFDCGHQDESVRVSVG